MSVIYKFLFPSKPDSTAMSLLLLALRILFGVLLMSHGVQKWANFDAMSESFPDPLGVGSQMSLILAIFGELACSLAFIFGFLYRLAMIPMIFTMGMAFFIIRKSKFPQNPKRSVRFSGKRTKRSVQKRKARNTQKAETKVL